MEPLLGFLSPWIIYTLITILHYTLPAKWVTGYVKDRDSGTHLRYRLNGLWVLLLMVSLWFILGYLDLVPLDWLYRVRWYSLAGAFCIGVLYTLATVLPYPSTGATLWKDLYLGRLENPQYLQGRIDAKMWLYLIGAVMLELHVLAFTSHYVMQYGTDMASGHLLCAILLSFFVVDYLTFERVHLYTYDFFAEKVGFKLGWGCLVFYPYFYAVPLWATAGLREGSTNFMLLFSGLLFFAGWVLARGANMQKFYFKTDPSRKFLGMLPETIGTGEQLLLVNGFWGRSRHLNYLGEILMGTGIALSVSASGSWVPWLYPLYYIALLVPRQIDDDKRCAAKYGILWAQYTKRVKYRIIPYIY